MWSSGSADDYSGRPRGHHRDSLEGFLQKLEGHGRQAKLTCEQVRSIVQPAACASLKQVGSLRSDEACHLTHAAREAIDLAGWTINVGSIQGQRKRMEDAWAVLAWQPGGGKDRHCLAVFDGVGGLPNGADASCAARDALRRMGAGAKPTDMLAGLNDAVRTTGGGTTAAIALLPPQGDGATFVGTGDSAVFSLDRGRLKSLLPMDLSPDGTLTGFLGVPHSGGHVLNVDSRRIGVLLLCTDGVHGTVSRQDLQEALRTGAADGAEALAVLFQRVEQAGALDNATAILAVRK